MNKVIIYQIIYEENFKDSKPECKGKYKLNRN